MAKTPDDGAEAIPDHNIEQIRDIIFGPQKRQYDQRFERLTADLRKHQEEARAHTDERFETLQKRSDGNLANAVTEFTAKLQKLSDLNTALQRELTETKSKVQADIRSVREQLSSELDAQVAALREGKVSREDMAELLQAMAMKLKGVEVLEELRRAARKKSGE